jgi:phosphatidylethanolamine/phosphatidyl-N-methylethanolamine N-methyltransferase
MQVDYKTSFYKIYDRLASGYDLLLGPLLKHSQKMAVHAMDIKPGSQVLEVGIGTGLTLPLYSKEQSIVGIDLSEGMLKKAEERVRDLGMSKVELHKMSAEELKFSDDSFDYVYAPSVFSVVSNPRKVLDEMVRVCKPDGTICVVSHFAGDGWAEKIIDRVTNPLTQKLVGFRTITPKEIVEAHPKAKVVLKKEVFFLNFSTLYLLKKITSH